MACGLVIAGSGVRATSVTLRESDRGQETIERLLSSLKEKNFDEERTIGFMFTTDGRRRRYRDMERNAESKEFKRLFSKVPLLGFVGQDIWTINTEDLCNYRLDQSEFTQIILLNFL